MSEREWIKWVGLIVAVLMGSVGGYVFYLYRTLPTVEFLKNYTPPLITRIYSQDGELMAELFRERRDYVKIGEIPMLVQRAFIAVEDAEFSKHSGVNFKGILRAIIKNIKARAFVQGGSTITQQLAKLLLLTPQKKISRKIKEIILAKRIERTMGKDRILELYLNQVYLGHGAYGVKEAARTYFRKELNELTLAEIALMAGFVRAPSNYDPVKHPKLAKRRQIHVLKRMFDEGYIDKRAMEEARLEPLKIYRRYKNPFFSYSAYFSEEVRRRLVEEYGEEMIYEGGLNIYTTMLSYHQREAVEALRWGLERYEKRHFRGASDHIEKDKWDGFIKEVHEKEILKDSDFIILKSDGSIDSEREARVEEGEVYTALITKVDDQKRKLDINIGGYKGEVLWNDEVIKKKWEKPSFIFKEGDVVKVKVEKFDDEKIAASLYQQPSVEGSIVCIDNSTGFITAMVGGYDFRKSQFNRAVQAKRQVGSAFKPFVYATALLKGYTPATVIPDLPIVYIEKKEGETEEKWKPHNYEESFKGTITIAYGLARSINLATIRILEDIGTSDVIALANSFGIFSEIPDDLTLGLGSASISLLEITRAYTVFPNKGLLRDTIMFRKLITSDQRVIEEHIPDRLRDFSLENTEHIVFHEPVRVYPEDLADVMVSLLEGVVRYGTGWRAKALGRPVGGKTGTTDDYRDAWFIGFTPEYTVGVWIGYDDRTPLGEHQTGSAVAAPVFVRFMKSILAKQPVSDFNFSEDITFRRIDPITGYLAVPGDNRSMLMAFVEGTEPKSYYQDYTDTLKGF